MITREDLDRAFLEQRKMTTAAIEGPGFSSYLNNLGLDAQDMFGWVSDYAKSNIEDEYPEWGDEETTFAASMLVRALALGVIIGRTTKP